MLEMRNELLIFAAFLISALLLSGCPGGGDGGATPTPPPFACPSSPSENGQGCPSFARPSMLYMEVCASKGGNVTYLRDNSTCCLLEVKCIGEGGYVFPVSINASTECLDDSGCKVAGCSSQLCVSSGEDPMTDCSWKQEYECYSKTACGCSNGACAWAENAEFRECIDKARGTYCPHLPPLPPDEAAACARSGGMVTGLPDGRGCFVNATCSTSINCSLFTYNCPPGFACSATTQDMGGVCKPSSDLCAGPSSGQCPEGSRCELLGSYANATGACRKLCTATASCQDGTECSEGRCMPTQNRACSQESPCPAGFACDYGVCTLAEGRFCNNETIACPGGYHCDLSQGAGATGSCEPMCGGAQGLQCSSGEVCITQVMCRTGEICMDYEGVCNPSAIPDSLAKLCYREHGGMPGNVSEIQKCDTSGLFIVRRTSDEFAYVHVDGLIVRECGHSAPPQDPECSSLAGRCGATQGAKCDDLEPERFTHCPPSYGASSRCPSRTEQVCAKLMVGANPVLRSIEWRTFNNGCDACNANSPTREAKGYWRGAC